MTVTANDFDRAPPYKILKFKCIYLIDEVVDNSALEPTTPAKIDEVVTNETPAKKIIITEGSTDGNLDVNSPKVIARSTSREM